MLSYSEVMKNYHSKSNENDFIFKKEKFQEMQNIGLQYPVTVIYEYISGIYELYDINKEKEKLLLSITSVYRF
jgi:hypothetical protein